MMSRWTVFVFGILGLWSRVECEQGKYDNYTLIRLYPQTEEQLETLTQFKYPEDEIEILKNSRTVNDSLDLLVLPDKFDFVEGYAKDNNFLFEVKQKYYGRTFDPVERVPKRRLFHNFNIYEYNSYAAIQDYLDTIVARHSDIVKLQTLGKSYEGRIIRLVRISANHGAGNPIMFFDAGIHAREWVAPAMALYLIHRLVNDPAARQRDLNGVDWFILPVANPDGYEYTRSKASNRMWRKTRSKHGSCYGVDGNRNYGFKWAVSGVSHNPCHAETYAGPKPFSEVETQMIKNVMMDNAKRLKLYVSIHSYGQYLVYPWGYTGDYLPRDWKRLDSLARKVSDAVQNAGGKPFRVVSAGKWYPAAGGSDDFAFGAVGVPYSYTLELTDGYEFLFPEYLLKQVLSQFYEGFRVFASQVRNEFGSSRRRTESKHLA